MIPRLDSTTPTLVETMRACLLRAGFSRARGSRLYVLGNPKAWLGSAYHEVLEGLPSLTSERLETVVLQRAEDRWNQAIARLEREAAAHPLDHRFGPATTWKGYYLVFETLRMRVAELSKKLGLHVHEEAAGCGQGMNKAVREQGFTALSGKLRGRIDLVDGNEIIDYKTGALFEHETSDAAPQLKAAYVRQLRIYGYLVHAVTAHWPSRGLLYPLIGAPVAVDLEPRMCEAEAADAVRLLERYNDMVAAGGNTDNLASPSPEACRWCPFKTICPSFWTRADQSWAGVLDGEAICGPVVKSPQAIHGGRAWSIALRADAGTVGPGEVVMSPLSAAVHPGVAQISQGDRVRVVGIGRRSDGMLFPAQRTEVFREFDAPVIELGGRVGPADRSERRP